MSTEGVCIPRGNSPHLNTHTHVQHKHIGSAQEVTESDLAPIGSLDLLFGRKGHHEYIYRSAQSGNLLEWKRGVTAQ